MIEIYTKPECPYCSQAKSLLDEKNEYYEERVIGKDVTRDEVIARYPSQKLLPIVVIDGTLIGSWTELLDYMYPPMRVNSDD